MKYSTYNLLKAKLYNLNYDPESVQKIGRLTFISLLVATFIGMPLAGFLTMPQFWDTFGLTEISSRIFRIVLFFSGFAMPFALMIFQPFFLEKIFNSREKLNKLNKKADKVLDFLGKKERAMIRKEIDSIKKLHLDDKELMELIKDTKNFEKNIDKLLLEKVKDEE